MTSKKAPWSEGPTELLQHAIEHLSSTDRPRGFNNRIAMISVDNAVELTIKTFIQLPKRVHGVEISRSKTKEAASFPKLLELLENSFPDRLDGIELSEIEWFHRLRNQLYHEGNGISVDASKVESYLEIAKILFENLFKERLEVDQSDSYSLQLGKFLHLWATFDAELRKRLPPKNDMAYYWKSNFIKEIAPEMEDVFVDLLEYRTRVVLNLDKSSENELQKKRLILQNLYETIIKAPICEQR